MTKPRFERHVDTLLAEHRERRAANAAAPRQQELLNFIRAHRRSTGMSPSVVQMMAAMKVRSPFGIKQSLDALVRKGLLLPALGRSRAFIPVDETDTADALHALVLMLEGKSGTGVAHWADYPEYADAVRALRDAGKFTEGEYTSRMAVIAEVVE